MSQAWAPLDSNLLMLYRAFSVCEGGFLRKLLIFLCLLAPVAAPAQRLPVLKQIDLPHSYYYREMYLPELTSGPSSVAWMPDSKTLIFSMAGYLWRQPLDSTTAEQLTNGPGYDYQPDVSPDGKFVVFSKYDHDAIELFLLDLTHGHAEPLTKNSAVNVEPRWSPDGKRIAYVSTVKTGHFHIFIFDFEQWLEHKLQKAPPTREPIQQLTHEVRSSLPRYYYSAFDHELSPTWSPDGKEIIYVSNHGHIHGTGGFWRISSTPAPAPAAQPIPHGPFARYQMAAAIPSPGTEIHYEETNWKARPDWSPDGHRVVYASYLGREWHQLWIMTSEGGDVFPLTYGDYDNTNPRWSRDGSKIAFISNRGGNLSLWVRDFHSGIQTEIPQNTLKYSSPMAQLSIHILDELGRPTAARISVTGEDGRAYFPRNVWVSADDGFNRTERAFEDHYFDVNGSAELPLPPGEATITITKGLGHAVEQRKLTIVLGKSNSLTVKLRPFTFPRDSGRWYSGDVHDHMNYAGTYRATPATLLAQMQAEDLNVVQNLIVNKEQRFPDIAYADRIGKLDPASTANFQILHGQEFHTSYWGHLGLLHTNHLIVPGYAGYPNTAATSIYPTNAAVADMAHAQSKDVMVGYVHPFDEMPDPYSAQALTDELPVDVPLGKVDYYEVVGFSDHKSSAAVWYKLLDLGFRIPAAAGTDAMTNYASLHGPVGLGRVFVHVPAGPLSMNTWLANLKAGHTFATNGPLLRFSLGGQTMGGELKLAAPQKLRFTASLRSIVPVDHLQIVCNGEVAEDLPAAGRTSADVIGTMTLARGGWCLLRAFADKAEYPVLDIYPYASTGPIYISVAGKTPSAPDDAKFFVAWIDKLIAAAQQHPGYNTEEEKQEVLATLNKAREFYAQRAPK